MYFCNIIIIAPIVHKQYTKLLYSIIHERIINTRKNTYAIRASKKKNYSGGMYILSRGTASAVHLQISLRLEICSGADGTGHQGWGNIQHLPRGQPTPPRGLNVQGIPPISSASSWVAEVITHGRRRVLLLLVVQWPRHLGGLLRGERERGGGGGVSLRTWNLRHSSPILLPLRCPFR